MRRLAYVLRACKRSKPSPRRSVADRGKIWRVKFCGGQQRLRESRTNASKLVLSLAEEGFQRRTRLNANSPADLVHVS